MPDPGIISSILSALGIGGSTPPPSGAGQPPSAAPQTPATPAAPSNPMAAFPQQSGLEKFLSNPLLQGAASAYLGTLATPRRFGWGGRAAIGGLQGLQGFNQAEQLREKLPLEEAQVQAELGKLPLQQAQMESSRAHAKLEGAQAQQYAPNPEMADHFKVLANDPSASPTQRQIYGMLADGVGAGSIKVEDAAKAAANEDMSGARTLLAKAQTNLANANASLVPLKGQALQAETSERGAQGALAGAKMGEIPAEEANLGARTTAAEAQANLANVTAAGGRPGTTTEQEKNTLARNAQIDKEGEAAWAARPAYEKAAGMVGGGTGHEAFMQQYRATHGGAPAGLPPPPTPGAIHGSHGGKPGWFDPSTGNFHPDGE